MQSADTIVRKSSSSSNGRSHTSARSHASGRSKGKSNVVPFQISVIRCFIHIVEFGLSIYFTIGVARATDAEQKTLLWKLMLAYVVIWFFCCGCTLFYYWRYRREMWWTITSICWRTDPDVWNPEVVSQTSSEDSCGRASSASSWMRSGSAHSQTSARSQASARSQGQGHTQISWVSGRVLIDDCDGDVGGWENFEYQIVDVMETGRDERQSM